MNHIPYKFIDLTTKIMNKICLNQNTMDALWVVFSRKKDCLFINTTYVVAILFCHYIFFMHNFLKRIITPCLQCHYKKIPAFYGRIHIFFDLFDRFFRNLQTLLQMKTQSHKTKKRSGSCVFLCE